MKIELNQTIKDLKGAEILAVGQRPLTVKEVLFTAVLNDPNVKEGEDKYKSYRLAQRIEEEKDEFTIEEIQKMKSAVGRTWGTVVVGFIYDLIENLK